ncbi:Dynamin family [Enterobacter hormaechei]|nr:Dynamin family [Enterobacter hormaechei]
MHTQTIFELSQEAERLLQLALNNLDSLKSMPIAKLGNDSNLLIVFYVQIMPDDFVMQLHRF